MFLMSGVHKLFSRDPQNSHTNNLEPPLQKRRYYLWCYQAVQHFNHREYFLFLLVYLKYAVLNE